MTSVFLGCIWLEGLCTRTNANSKPDITAKFLASHFSLHVLHEYLILCVVYQPQANGISESLLLVCRIWLRNMLSAMCKLFYNFLK